MTYQQIIPVTEARGILGRLAVLAKGDKVIGLTKGGRVVAGLIDPKYLSLLQEKKRKVLEKTFIDKDTEPFIRSFSDEEIAEWMKLDEIKP